MSEHYYKFDHRRHRRFVKHLKWFLFSLVVTLPILFVILFFTTSIFVQKEQTPVTSSVQTSVLAPSAAIFRSAFFQFQAGKAWGAVPKESTNTKFVYRRFNNNLIEAQLDIYVNLAVDQQINATRVLPATVKDDGQGLSGSFVSAPCAKETEKDRGYKEMVLQGVTFRCNTDATDYSVLVGKEGGTTQLDMVRPDGSKASYVIHFRDLRAIPQSQDIEEITNSFQTR